LRNLFVIALCLVFALPAFADERDKKIEAEIGVPVENSRALDCTGATVIACGQAIQSTTVGGVNNVNTYNCVSWNEGGPEKVFVLTTTGWNTIRAALSGMSVDLDVFILSSCSENACIAYGDASALTGCVGPGTYYIVVDGYGTAQGAFTLTMTCTACEPPPPPPENDRCEGAIEILCNTTINLSGNMTYAINDYSPGVYPTSCTGYSAAGKDITYVFTVPAGATIGLSYYSAADASFYIVTDCADPANTCVVGADATFSGGTEVINHVFAVGGTYYLILDNFSGGGAWTLTGTLDCPTGTEETSWGQVKTLYR
jgi:hypothetical protein